MMSSVDAPGDAKTEAAMKKSVKLDWHRFEKLTEARSQFAMTPCVYIQADARGRPIRVGKASKGLETRYRGGTGHAIDAAMHDSGNLVFVAAVSGNLCTSDERTHLAGSTVSHVQQSRKAHGGIPENEADTYGDSSTDECIRGRGSRDCAMMSCQISHTYLYVYATCLFHD